ncbi:MAG: signal peptidase II [Rickettsia sp.]|nr:signal peptidase II [Rickettsia sp.]
MQNVKQGFFKYFLIMVVILVLDQSSKAYLIDYFQSNNNKKYISLMFFLDLTPIWNQGISFGAFKNYQYANMLFIFINLFIMVYFVIKFFKQTLSSPIKISIILVLSGGIGNVLDRIFRGAVFDFIWFNFYKISFPVFNFADMSISFGAIIFFYYLIRFKKIF